MTILETNFTADRNCAKKLDANDSLSPFREKFYFPPTNTNEPFIYLCGNSLGLQPHTASEYIQDELDAWKKFGVDGHFIAKRPWMPYHEFLTQYSAELVGALEKEVVVMNSLSVNLHLLMASFYRPDSKKKIILIENNAFPSDKYAVQSQLKFHGNHPADDLMILHPDKGEEISTEWILDCFEQHDDEIAMVLMGGVNYY